MTTLKRRENCPKRPYSGLHILPDQLWRKSRKIAENVLGLTIGHWIAQEREERMHFSRYSDSRRFHTHGQSASSFQRASPKHSRQEDIAGSQWKTRSLLSRPGVSFHAFLEGKFGIQSVTDFFRDGASL